MVQYLLADLLLITHDAIVHPGVVTTNVLQGLGFGHGSDTPAQAAATPLYVATNPAAFTITGKFWVSSRVSNDPWDNVTSDHRELWDACEADMNRL